MTNYRMKEGAELSFSCLTDRGQVREKNEDHFGYLLPDFLGNDNSTGCLFAIADGIGGYPLGEFSSKTAIEMLIESFKQFSGDFGLEKIKQTIDSINTNLHNYGYEQVGGPIGTTLSFLVFDEDHIEITHLGDCRIYRIRDKAITQLTRDHTQIQGEIDRGEITPEEAKNHPFKSRIYRSLGPEEKADFDYNTYDLYDGDVFVLCSDGLHGSVDDEEIRDIVVNNSPSVAVHQLVELANQRGGSDNITVQVIKYKRKRKRKPTIILLGVICLLIALILIIPLLGKKNDEETPLPGPMIASLSPSPSPLLSKARLIIPQGLDVDSIKVFLLLNNGKKKRIKTIMRKDLAKNKKKLELPLGKYKVFYRKKGYLIKISVITLGKSKEPVRLVQPNWKRPKLIVRLNVVGNVSINGVGKSKKEMGRRKIIFELAPGKYTVKAWARGFIHLTREIAIDDQKGEIQRRLELERIPDSPNIPINNRTIHPPTPHRSIPKKNVKPKVSETRRKTPPDSAHPEREKVEVKGSDPLPEHPE